MFFGNSRIRFFFKSVSSIVINMERVNKKKEHNQHCSVFNVLRRSIANSTEFFLSCHEKAHDNKEFRRENSKPRCESQITTC